MFHCYGKWEQNMVVNQKYPPCIVSFCYFAIQSGRCWARRKETRENNSHWEDKTYRSSPRSRLSTSQAPAMLPPLASIPCSEHILSSTVPLQSLPVISPQHQQASPQHQQAVRASSLPAQPCPPNPPQLSPAPWTSFWLLGGCCPGRWLTSLSLTLSTEWEELRYLHPVEMSLEDFPPNFS